MNISKRKGQHAQIALKKDVLFKHKTNGFEKYDFVHCALPELNLNDISTETYFLNKKLSFPFMVSAITGGFQGALNINMALAEVCHSEEIVMSLGSQRPLLDSQEHLETYRIVRKKMPTGVVIGNVGAAQIVGIKSTDTFLKLVDYVEADALTVHLNPLQEVLQPDGDVQFDGVLKGLELLVHGLPVPVIIKEVGCGISEAVAKQLSGAGIQYIDVAGAGGTSWASIEGFRGAPEHLVHNFREWGIPTADSLEQVLKYKQIKTIASGGIDNGITMAKALAMGAVLCGSALPVFRTLMKRRIKGVTNLVQQWKKELQTVLFLTGCKTIQEMQQKQILMKR